VLSLLKKLSDNPKNIVVIISGNTRDTMEEHFDGLDVALLAEHGFYYRPLKYGSCSPLSVGVDDRSALRY
jgi:trehalose-6-phosphatase